MESIAVKMPTKAMIPKAIIKIVNIVRNKFDRMELIAILKFSLKSNLDDNISQK
jgi:hypothetical protein